MAQQTLERPPQPQQRIVHGGAPPSRKRPNVRTVLLILGMVLVAVLAIWLLFFARQGAASNVVALSGRIEGDDSAIAPKAGGRIIEITVREGDSVRAGDVIARLDDAQMRARVEQAQAAVSAAQARAQSARDQIAVLNAQLEQAQLQTTQADVDARGRVHQAAAELAAAQSDLAQQQASYRFAAFNKTTYVSLYRSGDVSKQQQKQAISAADQTAAAVAATARRIASARGALTTARANLANPSIRTAQANAVEKQIAQQQSVITGASADARQALAQLAEAQANRSDLVVRAPFSGTVITRAAEPGEVVSAGTPIVTLLNLHAVYLRGFIPEGQIGTVKIGQSARVFLDSDPNRPLDAYVMRIDPQATFTPENTYFRDDRVKQVFGVKLLLKNPQGYAKPGMPADGEILTGGTWRSTGRSE